MGVVLIGPQAEARPKSVFWHELAIRIPPTRTQTYIRIAHVCEILNALRDFRYRAIAPPKESRVGCR